MPRCDGIVARVRLARALGVIALCAAILCVGCGWRESAGSGVEEGSPKSTVGTAPVSDGDGSSADDSSAEDGSTDDPTTYEPRGFYCRRTGATDTAIAAPGTATPMMGLSRWMPTVSGSGLNSGWSIHSFRGTSSIWTRLIAPSRTARWRRRAICTSTRRLP